MRNVYEIRQGDWGRTLTVRLLNSDGSAIDPLPNTSTASFVMVHKLSGTRITGSATIGGAGRDELTYTFANGNTAEWGKYTAAFVVTGQNGETETVPTTSNEENELIVEVCPAL